MYSGGRRGSYSIDRILSWSFMEEQGGLECHMECKDGEVTRSIFHGRNDLLPSGSWVIVQHGIVRLERSMCFGYECNCTHVPCSSGAFPE